MGKKGYFTFRVSNEDLAYLNELAGSMMRSKGDVIRLAIYRLFVEHRFPSGEKEQNAAKLP